MNDFCIVYTGKSELINEIKKIKNYDKYNFIFSTWEGNESKFDSNDVVVFNKIPDTKNSLNFQKITSLSGLKKSQELGYGRTLKIRDDLIPTNLDNFLNLINNENINLLCWHEHNIGLSGYFVDYLISGKTEDLIKIYDEIDINLHSVPEVPYTKSLLNYRDKIKFFHYYLNEKNDFYWFRIGNYLSNLKPSSELDKCVFLTDLDYEHIIDQYKNL